MGNFFTLVSIENTKLWKRLSTKVMLIIMMVIIVASTGIYKYFTVKYPAPNDTKISENWKQDLQNKVVGEKEALRKTENEKNKMARTQIGMIKKSIAEDEYRINHNIKPETQKSVWTNVTKFDLSAGYGKLIALFLIIACAAVVAGEFSEGTMKMMISRPISRAEILTAKLVTTILYGLTLLLITFIVNFLLMGILFGFNGMGAKEMLWTGKSLLYVPAVLKTLIVFGLDFLEVIVYVIVAFAISAIFRSRSLATGFSLFLLLVGSGIIQMLAMYFSWGKYLPFGMSSFTNFVNVGTVIDGTSMGFAIAISAIYSVIFCFAGYFTFQKRDI